VCYLAPNAYHLQLVILRSADVFVHDFVAVIATHELYIYVAVILLRLNYFLVLRQVMSVFMVFSVIQRSSSFCSCRQLQR
jgi:hypothetical protein